jgi:hypothetical protein
MPQVSLLLKGVSRGMRKFFNFFDFAYQRGGSFVGIKNPKNPLKSLLMGEKEQNSPPGNPKIKDKRVILDIKKH